MMQFKNMACYASFICNQLKNTFTAVAALVFSVTSLPLSLPLSSAYVAILPPEQKRLLEYISHFRFRRQHYVRSYNYHGSDKLRTEGEGPTCPNGERLESRRSPTVESGRALPYRLRIS